MPDANMFATHGELLIENGYDLVLIRQGEKRPALDDWTELKIGAKEVAEWSRKYPRANIGIQTRHTPAIDIDVYDARIAAEMEAWVLDHLSDRAPVRVGQAPKRLLLFRTDTPFRKLKHAYVDGNGTKHAVEILGEGQQFVAFGIHPDTKRPFDWTSLENPLDLSVDDLPTLTHEDAEAILAQFDTIAKREGWKPAKKSSNAPSTAMTVVEDDDALLNLSQTVDDYDEADVRDALSLVGDAEDYDHWLQVGMALHHQFSGDDVGLEMWHEWSQEAHNYDADALDFKWKSFAALRNSGKATTLRYIIKCAKEGAKQKSKDEFERIKNTINSCNDVDELFNGIAAQTRELELQPHQIEKIANLIQSRAFEIDGVKMPIGKVRDAIIKARKTKGDREVKVPEWVSDFVWQEGDDEFYCLSERKSLSIKSYNARYDRHMLTAEDKALGRAVPAERASDAALTTYDMIHVDGRVYMPGLGQLITVDGGLRVNIYDDRMVPVISEAKTPEQKAALHVVKRHFEALFPDESERNLVISYLAYQVQCPAERINWALLIQGVEGGGKTWMQNLMAGVLGARNVGPVKPSSLFSDFNGWAEGRKLIFVEEIRLRGHDRYEVLDKIKPNITNDTLEITRKGRDPYDTYNVTCYVLFTNHADALSLSKYDRRYCIISTAFQSDFQIARFQEKHPDHFGEVFRAVAEHPDVMRGWLMAWPLCAAFDPRGRAPMTADKAHMSEINMTDEQEAIIDLISAGEHLDCTEYLLNGTELPNRLADAGSSYPPKTSALRAMLDQMGYRFLGRIKVDGKLQRYYTRRPDLFPNKGVSDIANRIRRILDGEEPEFL